MEVFLNLDAWIALLTLTFLEIVLGIDNIIFISVSTGKLPEEERKRVTKIGLFLAMFMRIALLFGISFLAHMQKPWFFVNLEWFRAEITGQSLILLLGGLFLIYKSTKEIHNKVDEKEYQENIVKGISAKSIQGILVQILITDLVFSLDSILTAVGMTNGINGAIYIMIVAVVVSVFVMMQFAIPVGNFVNKNPSIQILGLSFLILIGFMLLTESAHLSEASIFGTHVSAVPKGYLYFAISFSLFVEIINLKISRNRKK